MCVGGTAQTSPMMPYELGYLQPVASMFQLWGIYRIDNIFWMW